MDYRFTTHTGVLPPSSFAPPQTTPCVPWPPAAELSIPRGCEAPCIVPTESKTCRAAPCAPISGSPPPGSRTRGRYMTPSPSAISTCCRPRPSCLLQGPLPTISHTTYPLTCMTMMTHSPPIYDPFNTTPLQFPTHLPPFTTFHYPPIYYPCLTNTISFTIHFIPIYYLGLPVSHHS